ncbi:MAG: DUF3168 domain-containing protein [Planctomycetes bacterium]|nr:DUF3168 domain-containing protein [Planctomycetota bacterium]
MTAEEAIVAVLAADATLTALVGTRISPAIAGQAGARPNIVYQRISGKEQYSQDGHEDIPEARIQIDCYGNTYAQAKAAGERVIALLSGHRGGSIDMIFIEDSGDGMDGPSDGAESGIPRMRLNTRVHYRRA